MTTIEFNNEKNQLLKDEYDIDFDLIPEDQNIEIELTSAEIKRLSTKNVMSCCLYCIKFYMKDAEEGENECSGCPMDSAGNNCGLRKSTWSKFGDKIEEEDPLNFSYAHKGTRENKLMNDLIEKFKSEYFDLEPERGRGSMKVITTIRKWINKWIKDIRRISQYG